MHNLLLSIHYNPKTHWKAIYFATTQYWHIVDDFLSDIIIPNPKESQPWKTAKLSCNIVPRTYLGTHICSLACHWPPCSLLSTQFLMLLLCKHFSQTPSTTQTQLHFSTFTSTRNPQSTQSNRNGHLLTT